MVDKNFELILERVNLLTNEGYFSRHRELAAVHGVTEAWRLLESELPFGITRYSSFNAFEAAKKRESEGTLNRVVYLRK